MYSDLGMMPEAEDLLSDICRFYSEDQWLELSAPSYALLADCQKKLEMEDQYPLYTVYGCKDTHKYIYTCAVYTICIVSCNSASDS